MKKFISLIISMVLSLSLSLPTFALESINEPTTDGDTSYPYEILMLNANGKYSIYTINSNEEINF